MKQDPYKIAAKIILFLMITFSVYSIATAQDYNEILPLNKTYEAADVTIVFNGTYEEYSFPYEKPLFRFDGKHIQTTMDCQMKNLWGVDLQWKDTLIDDQLPAVPVRVIQGVDNGGFYCPITYGYDSKIQKPFIIIAYNTIQWYFYLNETEKIIDDSVFELPDHTMSERQYTDEEVTEFLMKFGDPGLVSNVWVYDFLFGTNEDQE